MTLDDLKAKLGPDLSKQYALLLAEYGPTLLAMTQAEVLAFLERLFVGDYLAAYAELLVKKSASDPWLLDEAAKLTAKWKAAADRNAAEWNLARDIAFKVMQGVALILLALVGL